jgi:hypothetical protein
VTEAQNVPETPTPSYLPSYKGPTIGAKVKRKVSATALGSKTSWLAATFSGPPLSSATIEQCETLCALTLANVPCCLSTWEPDTVVCPPPCTNP